MKRTLPIVLASMFTVVCSLTANERTNTFNFQNLEVWRVLDVYKQLTGLELLTDSRFTTVRSASIRLQTSRPVSKAEAAQLFEKALLDQVGVVIARLDDHQASVTWNGTPPANQPPVGRPDSGRQKLVITAQDVDPKLVQTFPWDTNRSVRVKPLGKSSEEIQLMKNRPTDIVSGGQVVARSPASSIMKQHGTNYALLLLFHTTEEATAAAAALRSQDSK